MIINTNETGTLVLKDVFSAIKLNTGSGENLCICMRDSGFEFEYEGVKYSAQKGVIKKVTKNPCDKCDKLDISCLECEHSGMNKENSNDETADIIAMLKRIGDAEIERTLHTLKESYEKDIERINSAFDNGIPRGIFNFSHISDFYWNKIEEKANAAIRKDLESVNSACRNTITYGSFNDIFWKEIDENSKRSLLDSSYIFKVKLEAEEKLNKSPKIDWDVIDEKAIIAFHKEFIKQPRTIYSVPKPKEYVPYQKCPVCKGSGRYREGHKIASWVAFYSKCERCPCCSGSGVIPMCEKK